MVAVKKERGESQTEVLPKSKKQKAAEPSTPIPSKDNEEPLHTPVKKKEAPNDKSSTRKDSQLKRTLAKGNAGTKAAKEPAESEAPSKTAKGAREPAGKSAASTKASKEPEETEASSKRARVSKEPEETGANILEINDSMTFCYYKCKLS